MRSECSQKEVEVAEPKIVEVAQRVVQRQRTIKYQEVKLKEIA